ncbi:DNA-directed RNA polymerase subunit beta' [candidate division WOR-3 bacterium]|nr:DNA-directed RNA polymerase subunit beta' [candidate division WOR-3 bacterium]
MNLEFGKKPLSPGDFDYIALRLASPETILQWSHGEVKKPETINYRTQKPEKGGLFCERIFGPVKDYECACGKYKHAKYRGIICEKCGVEVTTSKVRRERMGHITLATPVAHIWFYRTSPSYIALILNMPTTNLVRVLYYDSYVITDSGNTDLKVGDVIKISRYNELKEQGFEFEALMGGEGIRKLLAEIDLDELSAELETELKLENSIEKKKKMLKRLQIVEAFAKSGNRPEWMILTVLPVIPPDLRPLVPLEGGRYATSDLNDLYRRVITRNNRLKHMMEINTPDLILRNEKRMLQEAVDALIDNARRTRPIKQRNGTPLKSLSDNLKGKQGRFRQNLLGKRVDYSARSVIAVGPELKLYQCGLPKVIALEIFKPFIIRKLEEKNYASSIKGAKKLLEKNAPEVWEILENVVKDHPILLNRAPTLHRLGIQAFQPVLVEGKAIKLHPLVCVAFNADFDGDQMAIHLPVSFEAQLEASTIMLSANNLLKPANGEPVVSPTQDIVLGCYYLTKEKPNAKGEGKYFDDVNELHFAVDSGAIDIHARIKYKFNGEFIDTTAGRVFFNEILPEEMRFLNELLDKKALARIVKKAYFSIGIYKTVKLLDNIKDMGYKYATKSGLTFGVDDIKVPEGKKNILKKVFAEVDLINEKYNKGLITEKERYNIIIDKWTDTTNKIALEMEKNMKKDRDGFNPIFMMWNSGARGSGDQVKQLAGMRGLIQRPQKKLTGKEIIETPIISNFKEGMTVLEYFISTHGARKGLTDTALKTSEAGYMTRRLVDVAQDIIVTEEDCGTILGIKRKALVEPGTGKVIESLSERIAGRYAAEDVIHPITKEVFVKEDEEITDDIAKAIEESGIEEVKIRSVLTCESKRGVCRKCYGRNLATGKLVEVGEAVGVMAAQSIGEPGTQLTLRTFHTGGTSSRITEQPIIRAPFDSKIKLLKVRSVKDKNGETIVTSREGKIRFISENKEVEYDIPYSAKLLVKSGDKVKTGDIIYKWDPYNTYIINEYEGTVRFVDIKPRVTLKEEIVSGNKSFRIIEHREKILMPEIDIYNDNGEKLGGYALPIGAYLIVKDGQKVYPGDPVVKLTKEAGKSVDITGGLPRVSELFEARIPKNFAIVSDINGIVKFGPSRRGSRKIIIEGFEGEEKEYKIPYGRHLYVHDGERINAGEKLCEGPVNPHDILRIKGVFSLGNYLVNDVKSVYAFQGVKINDKHIETIIKQMLQKVKIVKSGDTGYIEGMVVDKKKVVIENREIIKEGGTPAVFEPVLLGITKASISSESFISAASFQETTKVLARAAIEGRVDELLGIKENVVMGNLIPAGTGFRKWQKIAKDIFDKEAEIEAEADEDNNENIGGKENADS